jgi:predicted CopG family antitoxin
MTPEEIKKHWHLDTLSRSGHDYGMAYKTVELDEEAYEILSQQKRAGQSFSEVIKERLGPRRNRTAKDLLKVAGELNFSEDFLDRVEEVIRDRAKSPARAANFDP